MENNEWHYTTLHKSETRRVNVDTACPRCNAEEKDNSHLPLECEWAQRVWRLSPVGFNFGVRPRINLQEWLPMWLEEASDDSLRGYMEGEERTNQCSDTQPI